LYRQDLTLDAAQLAIAGLTETFPDAAQDIQMMLDFLSGTSAQRGIVR
jgi:UDP-N-acetylglucosamine acyltransferase